MFSRWGCSQILTYGRLRTLTIILVSFIITLVVLYFGNGMVEENTRQRMLKYSIDSMREDGTPNRVIMNGVTGFIGRTNVRLSYMDDGYIRLAGENYDNIDGWQRISEFLLEPGKYCFTGMQGQTKDSIALQLDLEDSANNKTYYFQFDDEVTILNEKTMSAALYIRIYPSIGKVNLIARPAVYRNE